MTPLNFRHWSIKTRITIFTLTIFVLSIWSISFYASRMLERDLHKLLSANQLSAAAMTADSLNEQFQNRFDYLTAVADQTNPALLRDGAALQDFLESRSGLKLMFSGGAFITSADGKVIASFPLSVARTGTDYLDSDYILAALQEGKATVGAPVTDRELGVPVFVMATPIKDAQGQIIGAVAGVIDLSQHTFLDKVTSTYYGAGGHYFIVHPKLRLIIKSTDSSRNLQPLVAPGVVPALDRFLEGNEDSVVYVNPFGTEVLGSGKKISAAGWLLGITTPFQEAFAPIRTMQQRILAAALLLTLLTAYLTWWMLRRELSPMLVTVQNISTLTASDQLPQALPVTSKNEIGMLITAFNRLLETAAQRALALKESDGRANTLIETSPLPLVLIDDHGKITYLNQTFIKTTGYTPNEIPTLEQWWSLAYPDPLYRKWVADRCKANLSESKRTNQPFAPFEINIMCKDGSARTFMVNASTFESGLSRTHLVFLFDISETKQAERALTTTTVRLKEAQLMAKVGNWTLNLPGGELAWSDEIFRIFEIDPDKFGATYEAFLNAIHPDDRDAVNQAYAQSLETRLPYEIVHRLRMSDGRTKWVMEKCMSEFDAAGNPLRSRGMVQDITASKLAEIALSDARIEADRANSVKSQFLASVSHELRTPLNAVLGFAQLLETDTDQPLSQTQLECVHDILQSGRYLLTLVNGLLDLSSVESGNLKLQLDVVDLAPLVQQCAALVRTLAAQRGIAMQIDPVACGPVLADPLRLRQVLLNLVCNAIKYNRPNGCVHVQVAMAEGQRVRLTVSDTGHGIAEQRRGELFQPFCRLGAECGPIEGIGIGLVIARQLVEQMGGWMGYDSQVGVGSQFWIELPCAATEQAATPEAAETNDPR